MKHFCGLFFLCCFAAIGAQVWGEPQLVAKSTKNKKDVKIKSLAAKLQDERTVKNFLETLELVEKVKSVGADEKEKESYDEFMAKADEILSSLRVEVVSSPKAVVNGANFSDVFSVKYVWTQDGSPVQGLPVTVCFPNGSDIASSNLKTDENGIAQWKPNAPKNSMRTAVEFLVANQKNYVFASIPYVVSTNRKSAGCSIALVDFTKNGRPMANSNLSSSRLLAMLMRSGFTRIGNSDFTPQVVSDNAAAVQKAAVGLFGNSTSCLIYGTIEYEKVETENGVFTVALKGNLRVRSLAENRELLSESFTEEASKPTEAAAFQEAREKICRDMHDAILYGI